MALEKPWRICQHAITCLYANMPEFSAIFLLFLRISPRSRNLVPAAPVPKGAEIRGVRVLSILEIDTKEEGLILISGYKLIAYFRVISGLCLKGGSILWFKTQIVFLESVNFQVKMGRCETFQGAVWIARFFIWNDLPNYDFYVMQPSNQLATKWGIVLNFSGSRDVFVFLHFLAIFVLKTSGPFK